MSRRRKFMNFYECIDRLKVSSDEEFREVRDNVDEIIGIKLNRQRI